ncbi:MAG: hypothetical protein NTV62_00395 [Candidatus Gribaldobacteria bacterium]|nr:hypothetical protein [Candidatus Gribaldobacteria bacterium]
MIRLCKIKVTDADGKIWDKSRDILIIAEGFGCKRFINGSKYGITLDFPKGLTDKEIPLLQKNLGRGVEGIRVTLIHEKVNSKNKRRS